jgi:type IV pilus assembly protein PilF
MQSAKPNSSRKPHAAWFDVCAWLIVGLLLGSLMACSTPYANSQFNELTPVELNATQERAQRRLVLALAYFEQGQNDVALQEVRAALKIDPQNASAFNLLGLIHQRNNAPALAQQSFETSAYWAKQTASSVDLADAQHNLGWLLCEQTQYPRAQTQFEQALLQTHYRQKSKTLMASGICHLRAGQVEAARQSWQQSLANDPSNPMVRYQLALLDWQTQPGVANTLLAPLNAQQLGSAESLWLGVRVARALNNPVDMQQLGQQLLQRYPESVQAQAWIQRKFEEQ